ncbi:hypothetical protein LEP1GSC161_2630 [Leptospira santarosai str. CBC1416]|uniref:Uncharacterized protein n=1 Tax=Leptospira santarosai str. CBC1416 TaxID=1193059 RepID=M6VW40_9LEPT|nr:hypothetical protein LEP1GSC161_2630 [Leptospira santarosai str. CBC1416]
MTGIRILDKDNVFFEIAFINPNVAKPDPFSKNSNGRKTRFKID